MYSEKRHKTSKAIQPHNNTSNFNSHQHFLHSSTAQVLKPESFPNKPSNAYPWSIFQSSATNKFHCLKVASLRKDDRNLQQQQKSFERIKSCPQMYSISKKEAGSDQSSILLFIISFFVYWCILYCISCWQVLETCHAMSRLSSPSRAFLHLLQPLHGGHSAHIHQRVLTRQFLDRTPRATQKPSQFGKTSYICNKS